MELKFTYTQFRIAIHLLVAFVFLSELLIDQLPVKVYDFLKRNRDTVLGIYYLYLAYEIYNNIVIIIRSTNKLSVSLWFKCESFKI